jgi:hypothetical protein
MKATVLAFGLSSLALGACVQQTAQPKHMPGPVMTIAEAKAASLNQRKDEIMQELATCESGGTGEAERPIVGGRGAFLGRFQFMPRTVISYVQQRDGRVLSFEEAKGLAHDYEQAKELAKYMIFEQGRVNDWPLCARKIGLANHVAEIQAAQ